MASSKEFKDFILDQLHSLNGISFKPMMGEFLLYLNGILFGGIYDDRLLIKITNSNKSYHLPEEIPYPGAKPMFMITDVDDAELLKEIIETTLKDLKQKKTW